MEEKINLCVCGKEIEEGKSICYDCFKRQKYLREIAKDEIVFDVDNREVGFQAINDIALNLMKDGYRFMIYYAEGQKSPHLHLKDIPRLDVLNKEQLRKYKEKMLLKYTPDYAKQYVDLSLCPPHLIAEEELPHFKYGTPKRLLGLYNENNQNFRDEKIFNEIMEEEGKVIELGVLRVGKGSGITAKIAAKLSITFIARKFGMKVEGNGFACCPFHNDDTPSLKFYEAQGRYHCFGCEADGSILQFYDKLKKIKPDFKYK